LIFQNRYCYENGEKFIREVVDDDLSSLGVEEEEIHDVPTDPSHGNTSDVIMAAEVEHDDDDEDDDEQEDTGISGPQEQPLYVQDPPAVLTVQFDDCMDTMTVGELCCMSNNHYPSANNNLSLL
jgi:hypothetical protein